MAKKGITTKKKRIWPFVVIVVLVIGFFAIKGNFDEINDYFNPQPAKVILKPADLGLYKFSDLSNNKSVNVELWVINLGDETAINVTMNVRVRSENGTNLFEGNINFSTLILEKNQTCTGDYTIVFKSNKDILGKKFKS
jgi:spore maturation protein SpmB